MLLLISPALFTGLMGDDLFHFALLQGATDLPQIDDISLFHLFSFINDDPIRKAQLRDLSILSWWSSPSFTWNFWRPIAELTHYIDYVWLKDHIWIMHLHSIIYFSISIFFLHKINIELFNNERLALLITGLYALSATHGMTVAWLCNRNALLAFLFALISFLTFIRSQKQHNHYLYCISIIALIASLLSGEISLSLGGFLFAYVICLHNKGVVHGLLRLLPFLGIVILWYSIYSKAGFGAHGNTLFYINPIEHPLTYSLLLLERIPLISFSLLLALPTDIVANIPMFKWPIIILTLILFCVLTVYLKKSRYSKQALFFAMAALISIVPIACSPPQSRNLMFVSYGSAAIIAIVLARLFHKKNFRMAFYSLIVLHLVLSPLLLIPSAYIPQLFANAGIFRAASFNAKKEDKVVILEGDMMEISYLSANLFLQDKSIPKRIWHLNSQQSSYNIQQTDPYRLLFFAEQGILSEPDFLVRNLAAEPFAIGDIIDMNGLSIKILNINAKGNPTKFEAIFESPVVEHRFLQWNASGYKEIDIHAHIKSLQHKSS